MQTMLKNYAKWIEGADKSRESGKLDELFARNATNLPAESKNTAESL